MHVLHTFANNSHVPYLSWFAERARKEGGIRYTFLIMHRERPSMIGEMERLGFTCKWIKYDQRFRKWGMVRALPWLWWQMLQARPDIVHCNLFDDSLPGLLAAMLAGIKRRVVTKQDTGFHWMHARKWVVLDRLIGKWATHVISISKESRRFLIEKERIPAEKITLVHNGIPPALFTHQEPGTMDRLAGRFGTRGRSPVIGTVARFIAWKGYREIVEAARSIVARHPRALFLFCGTGGQEAEIRVLVKDAGLEGNVVFTGWVDRQDMASLYGLMDVYLHAALLEPFGLVYAEAMMNAVPVVSTATGAALDAIEDGRNGVLVRERTGAALAAGVERLLQADMRTIGGEGRKTAMRMYTFESMWAGTMAVYHEALLPER
jgi:glycosyltransferase involved in cell wall biosynthesis